MERDSHIGLYIGRDRATAVVLSADGQRVLDRCCVDLSSDEAQGDSLSTLIARKAVRLGYSYEQAFVAIDCGFYTQYDLHSQFTDVKQIDSTVKFEAEEAAATDAMNLAATYQVYQSDQAGSELTVYTANRQLMTDILLDIKAGGMDPTAIEPDAVCLARVLNRHCQLDERVNTLFVFVGAGNCYLIQPGVAGFSPRVRTLLMRAGQKRN